MVRYSDRVIYKVASQLYFRANLIIVLYTLIGMASGALGGKGWGPIVLPGMNPEMGIAIGVAIGGAIGFVIGSGRALMLKFWAQLALCQSQIERNTRPHISG